MKDKIEVYKLEQEYINIQLELQKKINLCGLIEVPMVKIVAGVDLAYWNKGTEEYAVCCIVVLDYNTHNIIEKKYIIDKVDIPYIPGCLAFRELPIFIKLYNKLVCDPDVILFDGNGYLHPRHMGLATHAGIILNKPTIGVAKSFYNIENAGFIMPSDEPGSYTNIKVDDKIYGRVLRTQKGVKPIFLSVGNKIDIDTAMIITNALVEKESHIPIPTRLADIMTHEIRKQNS